MKGLQHIKKNFPCKTIRRSPLEMFCNSNFFEIAWNLFQKNTSGNYFYHMTPCIFQYKINFGFLDEHLSIKSSRSVISNDLLWGTPFLNNTFESLFLMLLQGNKNSLYELRNLFIQKVFIEKSVHYYTSSWLLSSKLAAYLQKTFVAEHFRETPSKTCHSVSVKAYKELWFSL